MSARSRMMPGGYGEYSCVHKSHVYHLPDNVSFEDAALLDVLATDVHAYNLGSPMLGMTVAVLGMGIVGLDMVQVLRAAGITQIIAIAKYDFQAELAEKLGASQVVMIADQTDAVGEVLLLSNGGVDQVYECVGGLTDAVQQSMLMCRNGGKVIMLGGASKPRPIDLQDMLLKEVSIVPSNSYSIFNGKSEYETSIGLLRDGFVNHQCLITHRYAFEDFKKAFDGMLDKTSTHTIKAIFERI